MKYGSITFVLSSSEPSWAMVGGMERGGGSNLQGKGKFWLSGGWKWLGLVSGGVAGWLPAIRVDRLQVGCFIYIYIYI